MLGLVGVVAAVLGLVFVGREDSESQDVPNTSRDSSTRLDENSSNGSSSCDRRDDKNMFCWNQKQEQLLLLLCFMKE